MSDLLIIDNYDSFTYNLAQAFGRLGAKVQVIRNDRLTLADIEAMRPDRIVISPGPGTPDDGGVSLDVLREISPHIPTFGVCLGHQCLGQAYGGLVIRAPQLMHGKVSEIFHEGAPIFAGLPSPFIATRYHSLIVQDPPPAELRIIARTAAGEIMGLQHRQHPIVGVQFHPESILTECGMQIMGNFLAGQF